MKSKIGLKACKFLRKNIRNYKGASIVTGFLLVFAVMCTSLLAVGSGGAHPIKMFSHFNDDGYIDVQLRSGNVLINDGNNNFLSNEIIFKKGVPMQKTYTLANNTTVPNASYNTYINISYLTFLDNGDRNVIFMITPGNGTATIFSENEEGDFYPTKSISHNSVMLKNLAFSSDNRNIESQSRRWLKD